MENNSNKPLDHNPDQDESNDGMPRWAVTGIARFLFATAAVALLYSKDAPVDEKPATDPTPLPTPTQSLE